MTFKERYLRGEIPFEEIDDYIIRWNESDELCTLREYLGLNAEEEDVWIDESDEALRRLLDAKRPEKESCSCPRRLRKACPSIPEF